MTASVDPCRSPSCLPEWPKPVHSSRNLRILTNILIIQFVTQAYPLRLVLDGFAVHNSRLKLLYNRPVDGVTLKDVLVGSRRGRRSCVTYEILNSAPVCSQHDRGRIVRLFSFRLCVNSLQAQLFPHRLHQLIDVPTML